MRRFQTPLYYPDIEWSSDSGEATSTDESIQGEENISIELDPDAQARIDDDFQHVFSILFSVADFPTTLLDA